MTDLIYDQCNTNSKTIKFNFKINSAKVYRFVVLLLNCNIIIQ